MQTPDLKHKLIGGCLIIFAWITLHMFMPLIIPGPWTVINVFFFLIVKGELPLHLLHSLIRVLGGICLALVIGYPLGLWAGLRSKANSILSPLVYYLHPIPKIAFLPVFMVLFGLGNASKIALIFSILVFQIFLYTRDGVKDIPLDYFKVMKVIGAPRMQVLTDLIIPGTIPKLFSAIRVSLGISISVLFFAENYATRFGIGYFIMNSWIMVNYEQMFAGILAIALMGIILYSCLDILEKRLCGWMFIR